MDRLPDWLEVFANKVAKIPGVKTVLKPLYYSFKGHINKNLNNEFRMHALDLLESFDKCMVDNNIDYTLIFGTLLGAIREHGFIGHDLDIDVALFIEDRSEKLAEVLNSAGFRLKHRFSIDDGTLGCEESYMYKNTGVSIDIFYIHPAINELPYVCCWNCVGDSVNLMDSMRKYGHVIPRRIEMPISRKLNRVDFETIQVNISETAKDMSEYSYGPNFMTPDPNYVAPTNHRVIWYEKKAILELF